MIPQTVQAFYDEVICRTLEGTLPAVTRGDSGMFICRLRVDQTPECDMRCIAGILIPDDEYNKFGEPCIDRDDAYRLPQGLRRRAVRLLQQCHDTIALADGQLNTNFREDFVPLFNKTMMRYGVSTVRGTPELSCGSCIP